MKQKLKLNNGKIINLPVRIYTKRELDKMGNDYIEGAIFLNKCKSDEDFPEVPSLIKEKMVVINYHDFSTTQFSEEKVKESVSKQVMLKSDLIIFPMFKDENDLDFKTKVDLAEHLKINNLNIEIIMEMSYKSNLNQEELFNLSPNFDFLSVFYGAPYGHYKSFSRLAARVISFKRSSNKKVICMACPLKFSGENQQDSRLMLCFPLVSDMWSKNWKGGGGSDIIKVIDPIDYKSKEYTGWLESDHLPNEVIDIINRTVYDLFRDDSKGLREEFESYVYDAALNEVLNLEPTTIGNYVYEKFFSEYFMPIIAAYNEKIISSFRENPDFKRFSKEEIFLLEKAIRKQWNPIKLNDSITTLNSMIIKNPEITITQLLKKAEEF